MSYVLAQAAAFKFGTLGVESSAYESINAYYLAARKHKKRNKLYLIYMAEYKLLW